MTGKIQKELKQSRPFDSAAAEAYLNLVRTADVLLRAQETAMKPQGLSHSQYNVLRILRGAGAEGLPCGEIAERMVQHDPDITRLVDRLEKRGLVGRERESRDRRVVRVRIREAGLRVLRELDRPLREHLERGLGRLGQKKLRELISRLEEIREGWEKAKGGQSNE